MKVLVTGGAGFIGSNLAEALVNRGDEVTILDNFSTGSKENISKIKDQVKIINESCLKIPELDLSDFDLIFHIGIPSSSPMYKDDPTLVGKAINGFINVMELAKTSNARIVYASTSSMYAQCNPPHREDMEFEPFDYYTEARITMERLAEVYNKLHDLKSAGMRFFSVYGPHEKAKGRYANIISQFYWEIREGESPEIYGDGEQTRDFTHVSDVVDGCLKAAEADIECEAINIGTGRATSFNEIVEILNRELGKSVEPEYVDNPIPNYVYQTQADISKAKRLLGYEPSVSLEDGIKMKIDGDN